MMPAVAELGVWNLTILKVTLAAAPVLIRKPVTTPAVGENSGEGVARVLPEGDQRARRRREPAVLRHGRRRQGQVARPP